MTLQCIEHLAQIMRAFSPINSSFIETFLPALSSLVTQIASGDIKANMSVRVAAVDLWQVVLRNCFDSFEKKLTIKGEANQKKLMRQMMTI